MGEICEPFNKKINHQNKKPTAFEWIDRFGAPHDPKDMDTRHLFFTLRMIWNHSVTEDMKIHPYQEYDFGEFYTEDYMSEAVKKISEELMIRDDLEPYYLKCLKKIKNFVKEQDNKTLTF